MGRISERRALFLQDDPDFDPYLIIDVNEYLIEEWPKLTAKQRKSVWVSCQTDPDFDYGFIYEQIDQMILTLAETNPAIDLSDIEIVEEYEEEDDDE